jgi:secreted trypsin-like serine protease
VLAAAAPPENSAVTVAGWGATEEGGKTVQQLAFVELDVEPQVACMYTYSRTATPVTQKMFCASKVRERKDACQGDSGGGSFRTAAHDTLELVGIVSFGKGCATPGYPGVYTRLADFRQWLTEVQQAAGE